MSWTYEQLTGRMIDGTNSVQAIGYSGQPPHTNKPEDENLEGQGPIPSGNWIVAAVELETERHGPFVIVLKPDDATREKILSYGRDPDSFRIHGERVHPPYGYASDGCIIISRDIRELIWNSMDHDLQVVSGGIDAFR